MDDVDQFLKSLTLDQEGLAQQWMSLSSIVTILVAGAFGFLVLWVYQQASAHENRDRILFTVIPVLTILMAVIMRIEGVQIVLFFGIFGILSIVRFRSEITDQKGITFILFAVILGVLVGVGNYVLAFFAWALVTAAILLARRIFRDRTTYQLTVKIGIPLPEGRRILESWLAAHGLEHRFGSFATVTSRGAKTGEWEKTLRLEYRILPGSTDLTVLEQDLAGHLRAQGFEMDLRLLPES